MPATSTQQGHVLTKHTALSPPHPAWRHAVVEDVHRWGTWPCPLGISKARHRTATRVQASQPLLRHPWMSLQSREAPTEH